MLVMEWLGRHHGEALQVAFEEFGTAIAEDGRTLSEADDEYFLLQASEWVLAEGTVEVECRTRRFRDLVVEGGPLLEADQRLWFERATQEPLCLWRVTRVDPGVGLELRNFLDDSADIVYVNERSASKSIDRLAVIAARLGRWKDSLELASVYSIPASEVLNLFNNIKERVEGDLADPDAARFIGRLIRDYWVWLFTRRPVRPEVFDGAGDPLELTTDHWQILDQDELERRLAGEPDVHSNRPGWSRVEDPSAEMSRTLLALNPGKKEDRLEVFARTRKLANEGRAWLEQTAGPSLRFLTREIVDPMSERVLGGEAAPRSISVESFAFESTGPGLGQESELPPEAMSQLMENLYRKQYEGLADQAIPALGNKSPREALKEPGGRRLVRLWLEGFERNEERMAADTGRQRVDLGFLWREVGLKPSPR